MKFFSFHCSAPPGMGKMGSRAALAAIPEQSTETRIRKVLALRKKWGNSSKF